LFEWLRSPIVYLEEGAAGARMRSLAAEYFRPRSCLYHYLHMAEGNFRTYLKGERVRLKKYFYVLRPVLACQWIERTGGFPPMEFQKLVEAELKDDSLRQIVLDLLERKRRGDELDEGPALPELNLYLGGRIAYHQDRLSSLARVETPPLARLDGLFRASVAEAFPFGVSGA
jgi:predicted nucleotidyltransferase